MSRLRLLFVMLAVLIAVAAISACGSDDDDEGSAATGDTSGESSKEPVVIGTANASTGFFNVADGPASTMLQFGVDDYNAEGGAGGHKLSVAHADTKSDANEGAKAALKLIDEDGADVIFPSVDYDFGRAAAVTAVGKGKLVIGGAGSAKFGKQGIGDLAYNVGISTNTEGAAMAEYAYNDLGLRKPYVLLDSTIEYTKQTCAAFKERWSELAGEGPAGEDTFKNGDPSIAAQITRMKGNSDFDSVVLCSYNPGAASAVRQIRSSGVDKPIIASASMDGEFWLEAVPNLSDFYYVAYASLFGDDPDPKVNELFDRYRKETGEEPTQSTSLMGYRAVQVLAKALEESDSIDGAALAGVLENLTDHPTVMGEITYTPELHFQNKNPVRVMKIVDGKQSFEKLVTPEEVPEVSFG